MGLLDGLQPQQRQILMVGAPVVAVFALGALRKQAAPATDAAATDTASTGTATSGWTMPSTDAIGTGQLADFESTITGQLGYLSTTTATLSDLVANPPAPPAPLPAPPATRPETGPVIAPAASCSPPPGWPGVSGEVIIKRLDAPGGGCWYFSNYGGVANVGGAPFKGAAINNRFGPGYENPPRYAVDAQNLGSGYVIISNRGERYSYP
jgi:hypothetical protein